jgi:tRNA1(Val) A37 N6-methylase TrmN6
LPVNETLLRTGLSIVQTDDSFRYTLDSMLLAYFTPLNPGVQRVLDLCSGNIPIPLYLSLRTEAMIDAVDHHPQAIHNAQASILANQLSGRLRCFELSVQRAHDTLGHDVYDVITCNPPYFSVDKPSVVSQVDHQASARHETTLSLEDVLMAAKRLLKNKGILSLIHRVERLDELVTLCRTHRLVIKTLRFVHSFANTPASVVLVTIKKGAQTGGLQVLPPVITWDPNQTYSPQIEAIYDAQFMV